MSDSDKMRAEFEVWAKFSAELDLLRVEWKDGPVSDYAYKATAKAWQVWQAGYQAGQKAEREATQLKNWDGVRLGTTLEGEQ